jgi:hypothetical protein
MVGSVRANLAFARITGYKRIALTVQGLVFAAVIPYLVSYTGGV